MLLNIYKIDILNVFYVFIIIYIILIIIIMLYDSERFVLKNCGHTYTSHNLGCQLSATYQNTGPHEIPL